MVLYLILDLYLNKVKDKAGRELEPNGATEVTKVWQKIVYT